MQGIYPFIREFPMASKQNSYLFYCEMDHYKVKDVQAILAVYTELYGPGSVVGTATAYGLDGLGIESRWGEIFRTSPDRP